MAKESTLITIRITNYQLQLIKEDLISLGASEEVLKSNGKALKLFIDTILKPIY